MSVMTAYNRDEKAAEHAISEVALEAFLLRDAGQDLSVRAYTSTGRADEMT